MVKTNAILSQVATNVAGGLANDIRGIRAPVVIPNYWAWLFWGLGFLLAAALVWWLFRKRRRPQTPTVPLIIIPPHEKALARLREALDLLGQPGPFCTLVSDTIRIYVEDRFTLRAPERTTEEFLEELQRSSLLTLEQKNVLGDFLMRCDLVKFARYEPQRPELEAIYDSAVRLVEETQTPPTLPASTATPAA